MKKKLIIADDNALFRDALKKLLITGNWEVIAEAENKMEVIEKVEKLKPDLLLLDIRMPELDGLTALKKLKSKHPNLKIIILTLYEHFLTQALELGANGYCVKYCDLMKLLGGIERVFEGETFICTE